MTLQASHVKQTHPVQALIVDDEPEALELIGEICRRNSLDVTAAQDGRAAIAAIERAPSRFDLVITDLHLPGADGFQVLQAARAANPSCYVVMITGYATIDAAVRAVREGAYDFLAKPFALGQFEVILWRIRDRMALEGENRELLKRQQGSGGPIATGGDSSWRLEAIEERLARIEALLRKA
jgi:DNA-binding NtrC family response regulator